MEREEAMGASDKKQQGEDRATVKACMLMVEEERAGMRGAGSGGPATMVSMLSKRMTGVAVLEETQKPVSLFPDAEQSTSPRAERGAEFPSLGLRAADLGCGTGSCGAVFRSACREMIGCDISKEMCKVAEEKNIYDRVEKEEAARFLSKQQAESFDLILAGDVFPYIADLQPILALAHRCMRQGGRFLFTVEAPPAADAEVSRRKQAELDATRLSRNARFSHAEEQVKRLCGLSQLEVEEISGCTLGIQDGKFIRGQVYLVKKQGSQPLEPSAT
ncbi:hypothetical protein GUITHDRAFT_161375 [Guillardia theta CCMP2712]|uniref:Methyltransferase type 11 domain-containing protein n=1 Tax=Guillardia theta (strain CCMP2712) TaxID=905079 RepID=L1JVY7_GUITC|nr:hypothetical protein GUITHDRAFT_161375 [Guillardia theta CCMP2712]EKX52345.1 hypothetical protein GUITHDRAFT_161375 [Guillardia theta CCMP2712]|eukprot:XP_005839325.1 hypothetical protein GUITHDRAFT_161375 [Guillardia theta CCMP2712]